MAEATTPRIAPLADGDASPEQAEILEALGPAADLNLFRTMAHHPALMRSWLRFGGRLLQRGTLSARDREVAILRTAARCGSSYEWGQHVGIARSVGLTDDEIRATAATAPGSPLGELDLVLLRASDELLDAHALGDDTWAALATRYDDVALIELTLLVGHYAMLAGFLSSAGVQTERRLPEIGEVD